MPEQMLNGADLNQLQGLLHYLSEIQNGDLAFDVSVFDSNGDFVGDVRRVDERQYQFFYPIPS